MPAFSVHKYEHFFLPPKKNKQFLGNFSFSVAVRSLIFSHKLCVFFCCCYFSNIFLSYRNPHWVGFILLNFCFCFYFCFFIFLLLFGLIADATNTWLLGVPNTSLREKFFWSLTLTKFYKPTY